MKNGIGFIRRMGIGRLFTMRAWVVWMVFALAAGWPNEARRQFPVMWRNDSDQTLAAEVHAQLYQAASATAAPFGQMPWKRLQILPRQTVIESATVQFPAVKAKTQFLIQWLDATNHVLGHTEILVYPTNLLEGLGPLTGRKALGIFDPQNLIKPLLLASALECEDLQRENISHFTGQLAIIAPMSGNDSVSEWARRAVADLTRAGVAVVWIKLESASEEASEPAVYPVTFGGRTAILVRPRVVSHLAESPRAQLNLLRSAQLAFKPESLSP
jgi:hypothetical protein